MERWLVALLILIAVAIGMAGQAWVSWLEHKRRTQAMEIIKAAIEAGREPPAAMFEQLEKADPLGIGMEIGIGFSKKPWAEAVLFGALGAGFWVALAFAEPDKRTELLVIAATMSAVSIGCLGLAVFRGRDDQR